MTVLFSTQPETYIDNWYDTYLSETKKTGYICTFQLLNQKQRFFGLNDLQALLKLQNSTDTYLSLNAFSYGTRESKSLKQIRNIGIDVDCYKKGLKPEEALSLLKQRIQNGTIPCPNLVLIGRGIQLIYGISGGASPQMAFLSQYITGQFVSKLLYLGADMTCTDVSRVLRFPGTKHSGTDKKIKFEIWRSLEYTLQELYEYVTPLEKRRKSIVSNSGKIEILPPKKGVKNLYSLNTKRKNDLEKLVAIRKGDIETRNVLTYIYAYTVALLVKNKEATIEISKQLNEKFNVPQKVQVVKRTAGNGYDDAMEFFTAFQENNFTQKGLPYIGIIKPMKSSTIIDKLSITQEEIKSMATIISSEIRKSRNTEQKRKERGSVTRKEYLEQQHLQTKQQLDKISALMLENPKIKRKELANQLGVSIERIKKLKQQLKK
ncbi:hypothetical protein [Bacillus cereus]|uniref:Replication protein n=2 Tax=Bacillus cereus group TaxID=86661 RepID=R8ME42_BACCX|nr:hypothetical protein [Bacillus cereus]EOP32319.1 hypothetical protein IK1_05855 [Bacillus cereus VD146]